MAEIEDKRGSTADELPEQDGGQAAHPTEEAEPVTERPVPLEIVEPQAAAPASSETDEVAMPQCISCSCGRTLMRSASETSWRCDGCGLELDREHARQHLAAMQAKTDRLLHQPPLDGRPSLEEQRVASFRLSLHQQFLNGVTADAKLIEVMAASFAWLLAHPAAVPPRTAEQTARRTDYYRGLAERDPDRYAQCRDWAVAVLDLACWKIAQGFTPQQEQRVQTAQAIPPSMKGNGRPRGIG
jgi:hypothetical protein